MASLRALISSHQLFRMTANRKGALAIVAGTACGQLLALCAAPFLTRLYTPNDYGVFTIVSSLVVTFGAVAAWRFEMAIPVPSRDTDGYSLVFLGLIASVLSLIGGTVAVAVFRDQIAEIYNAPALTPWLWCVPPISTAIGISLVLNQLAVRRANFGLIARRNVLQSVTTVTAQTTAGVMGLSVAGLVLGFSIGQAAGTVGLLTGSGLRSADARCGARAKNLATVVSRYRKFPLILAPSGLINVAGLTVPVLVMAVQYGVDVAGWLGLTQRVLALPVALFGAGVGQVYTSELARKVRGGGSGSESLFYRTSKRLALLGASTGSLLFVAAPWAFTLVFGDAWTESGAYAQALAVGLAFQFFAAPLSQTLVVLERQLTQLLWDCGRLALTLCCITLSYSMGATALQSVWIYSLASAFAYGVSWTLSRASIRAVNRGPD